MGFRFVCNGFVFFFVVLSGCLNLGGCLGIGMNVGGWRCVWLAGNMSFHVPSRYVALFILFPMWVCFSGRGGVCFCHVIVSCFFLLSCLAGSLAGWLGRCGWIGVVLDGCGCMWGNVGVSGHLEVALWICRIVWSRVFPGVVWAFGGSPGFCIVLRF